MTQTSNPRRQIAHSLILSVMLTLGLPNSKSYAHDPRGDAARAVALATQANADAKAAIAEVKAARQREEDAKSQRDKARFERDKARSERDVLAGENVELRRSQIQLKQEIAPLRIEAIELTADLERQRKVTKIWTVGALIAGVILGGAAGAYVAASVVSVP